MKKRLLISIGVLLFSCLLIFNMDIKTAFADTHLHTDDCYNVIPHAHIGNSSYGGGCYGGINYHVHTGGTTYGTGCYGGTNRHYHTGNSTTLGGCYTRPIWHEHTGSSISGNGCYGTKVYHSHTGSSSSGDGCYGTEVYHSHTGSSSSGGGCYGQANYHSHSGSSTSGGGCYGQANYHSHSGSSTSGGGCYGQANYHSHSGSSTSGGGCYGKANYHSHGPSCYGTCGGSKTSVSISGQNKWVCTRCGSISSSSGSCTASKLTCSKTTSTIDSYSRNCGMTTSTIVSYSRNCGKSTSTIESYSRNCGKTTSTIESYSRNCGKTTTSIDYYRLNCGMTTATVTGYALNCGKTDNTVDGYSLGCSRYEGEIISYYLNCGKSSSTIDSFYRTCDKIEGKHYNGNSLAEPICNSVVTSIAPANPVQTISLGGTINTTAIASYLDGSTRNVSCTVSGFDAYKLGDQTVTLTYSGLVGNAMTTGTRTCYLSLLVKPSSSTIVNSGFISSTLHVGYVTTVTEDYYLNVADAITFANGLPYTNAENIATFVTGCFGVPGQCLAGILLLDSMAKGQAAADIRSFTDNNINVHITVIKCDGGSYYRVSAWDGTYGQIRSTETSTLDFITYTDLYWKIGTTTYHSPYTP